MTQKSDESDATLQIRIADLDIRDGGQESPVPGNVVPDNVVPGSAAPGNRREARLARKARRISLPLLLARVRSLVAAHAPKYPRPGRTGWRRWIPSWRQWLGGVSASVGLSALLLGVAYAATDIPDNLNTYATQQDNVYFWADGTPMARTGWVQRQAMPLKDIPEDVRWAVLAAENASFYSDSGISLKGLSRALFRTVGQGDTQGGSTITQQYVKNVYLNQNQTISRKFTEAMISLKLDNRMSKDDILEGYLNTSWFGRGCYGIQRAAQAYYGKDVSELDAGEGAFLASLLKGSRPVRPDAEQRQPGPRRRALVLDPGPDGRHRQTDEGRAGHVHEVPRAAEEQPAVRHR